MKLSTTFFLILLTLPVVHAIAADPNEQEAGDLSPLVGLLGQVDDADIQRDVLAGIHEAVKGRRKVTMPGGWRRVYAKLAKSDSTAVREKALLLSLIFGDRQAAASLRKKAADPAAKRPVRLSAIQALVQARVPGMVAFLQALTDDAVMRRPALRGLAAFDDESTPPFILDKYRLLNDSEKRDAVNTLASRSSFALALLNAIADGKVASRDVSAFTARQMMTLGDPKINKRLRQVWGSVRETTEDRAALIADYKKRLTPDVMQKADRSRGRFVFERTCASCHKLFDAGQSVGPELTGSQRRNLDYVLTNLLDPNAIVGRDYRMTIVVTELGRVVTGIVRQENSQTLSLQTANDLVIIPKEEIDVRKRSPLSMMPDGMLQKLSAEDVRDLIAYLASPDQVPLPASADKPPR